MKNITSIYITLSFFVYIISCSIIYMIIKDIYNKYFDNKVRQLKSTFGKEILNQLEDVKNNNQISTISTNFVRENLNKRSYIKVFNDVIIEYNEDESNHCITREYMLDFEDIILSHIKKYKRKDNIIKSYCVILLGEYKLNNFEISEFLFDSINTKSIYLRISALKSMSKIGNLNNFIRGLEYMSNENQYIDKKILIDILDQFGGNKELLNKKLISKFEYFDDIMQVAIIEHLKNDKTISLKEILLEILKSSKLQKEVKISLIKYFKTINYEPSKYEIIKLIENGDWEYRAVCASTLGSYKCKESILILLKTISDKNWYVRYNSAISLLKFEEENILDEVIKKNDKYSSDIIFYAMFMKNKISYEDYIIKSKKLEGDSIC